MTQEKLGKFLKEHDAGLNLYYFAKDLTLKQFHATCQNGGQMLWLHKKMCPEKANERRLAAAHCANTARHYLKDKRSTDAIDWIIENNGKEPPKNMKKAAFYAANAAYAVTDADAAYALASLVSDSYGDFFARSLIDTAHICREYLPLEKWGAHTHKPIPHLPTDDKEEKISQITIDTPVKLR